MNDEKCYVVIGGTSGIGRATAELYHGRGHRVVLTGRDAQRCRTIAGEIGERATGIALDLAEPERIAAALATIDRVDGLVIAAIERDANSVREYDIGRAKRLVTIKLVGYTEAIHTLLPKMTDNASVVLFGGLAKERPYPGSTTVTSVNGGITSMIRTLATELAPIRFNAVHPGIIGDSPAWEDKAAALEATKKRTPGGQLATIQDVVGAVDFLLTNQGVNGVNLFVDRGWMLT
ncbi:MAG: SDR family oxidoreductase [Rhodospirillales bacterium]|nr:SDR family oxidoreductase [Rhodospirillales bacterium]